MSVTWIAADSDPAAVGLKETEKVQLAPAVSVIPQVLAEMRNEEALVPVDSIEEIVRVPLPVFFSVTLCELEVVPTGVVGKFKVVGLRVTVSGAVFPVPLTPTL